MLSEIEMFAEEFTGESKAEDSANITMEQLSGNSNHAVLALASATLLASCGGGGGNSTTTPASGGIAETTMTTLGGITQTSGSQNSTVTTTLVPPTQNQAASFLMQASLGIPLTSVTTTQSFASATLRGFSLAQAAQATVNVNSNEVSRVQLMGFSEWLDEQFAMPVSKTVTARLEAKGFGALSFKDKTDGFDSAIWRHLIIAPDTLRQRIALALSEILVVGIDGLIEARWPQFSAAAYYELLCDHCFGNFRDLLQAVSTSPAMGAYLTFKGNQKADPVKGSFPDENYAREILQLFTIGLVELNINGTPKLTNGIAKETYTQEDISQLARIFTGWNFDFGSAGNNNDPGYVRRPMKQFPNLHETELSTFLGTTVPARANTEGEKALTATLDIIFAHSNVAPFISKQLIQRLVTSNPSPAYVERVATIFNNDGTGVKGNLKAVIKAIFLDNEARNDANLANPKFGKVREPMLRFLTWARAFNVSSPSDEWYVGDNIADPNNRLGQSPLRSPSVFNFFRPGYVPPNSDIAVSSMVAPELQITNEISIVSYINFMQRVVSEDTLSPFLDTSAGTWDLTPDYSQLIAIADNADSLMNTINFVMTGNQLSATTLTNLSSAIATMPFGDDAKRKNRIYAALTLVMASPEFIVQK